MKTRSFNSLHNEIRLALFMYLLSISLKLVPKEAKKTLFWLRAIPFDELLESKQW